MRIFEPAHIVPQLPSLLLTRRLRFTFELLPYEARGLRARKIANFFVAGMNQFILPARPFGYPVIAQVEPSNVCNLRCPLCLSTRQTHARPPAMLPFETFRRLMDEIGDTLLLVVLWNWGEPFLNPEFPRMIACASAKGIITHTSTNGNVPFDRERCEAVIDAGLSSIVFAVDGTTQDVYAQYRRGGRLSMVLDGIRTLTAVRRERGVSHPRINFRFVAMKHNEPQLEAARALAGEVGADFFTVKSVDMPTGVYEGPDAPYIPGNEHYRRYEYDEATMMRRQRPFVCMRPWKRLTMDSSGEIIPCEYDYRNRHSFGRLTARSSAMQIWKNERAAAFRRAFQRGHNDTDMCRTCSYKNCTGPDCVVEKQAIARQP